MKSVVGLRLIKLLIAVLILACKLYISNMRFNTKMTKLIRMNKEVIVVEYRRGGLEEKERMTNIQSIWVEKV